MIIHPEFLFVCNPRTASRATTKCLSQVVPGCIKTEQHHPTTRHPILKKVDGRPIYGVVRNPYDQIVSWYHHAQRPVPFEEFVKTYTNGWLYNDRLAVYAAYMTEVLPYEMGVGRIVGTIASTLTSTKGTLLYGTETIGRTGPEPELWTDALRSAARSRFRADFESWNAARTRWEYEV